MRSVEDLNQMIVRIYELGLDVEAWPDLLDEIAAFYGCRKAGYMHIAHDDTERVMGYFRHPEPDAPRVVSSLQVYEEMPPGSDIWLEILNQPGGNRNGAFHCNKLVPLDTLLRSDHYNMVVKHVDCYDNLGMRVAENEDYGCYLSIYSDGPQRMFTDEDFALHTALHPHIKRIVDFQSKFRHELRAASMRGAALDELAAPVLIVDARARIVFANRAGQRLLNERDGLEERGGKAVATENGCGDKLAHALAKACGIGDAEGPTGSGISIMRSGPKDPLGVQIIPFDPAQGDDPYYRFSFDRLTMLIFADPNADKPVNIDILATVFSLRPSEARIAELLVDGQSQKEIAASLQLSEGTARWHVKNLMSKLNVRRESQLVSKLAAALPPVAAS